MTADARITHFTGITLRRWMNFAKSDVALQRRLFVVGANAVGKSNFLDAFQFLHDLVADGGGIETAVRRRKGVAAIRTSSAPPDSNIEISVQMCDTDGHTWTYELHFSNNSSGQPIVQREFVGVDDEVRLDRPNQIDHDDPYQLSQTAIEQVAANRSFRSVAQFFETLRHIQIDPFMMKEQTAFVGGWRDLGGGTIIHDLAKLPSSTRKARLKRIRSLMAAAIPELIAFDVIRDRKGDPHLRARFENGVGHEFWQEEDKLSDGTLRLFGLIWAALEGDGPLLIEEPELSLHPSLVSFIPAMLYNATRKSDRQMVITTHSADLLLDGGIGLDEVALLRRGRFGTTIQLAKDESEVAILLKSGMPLGEIVLPMVAPSTNFLLAIARN